MSKNVLDRIKKVTKRNKEENKNKGGGIKTTGQFYKFEEGDNQIRVSGDFLELRVHNLGQRFGGAEGVIDPNALKGDDRLPFNVVCSDWDMETGEDRVDENGKKTQTCPICRVRRLAFKLEKLAEDKEEKAEFKDIASACYASKKVKWNIIDRANPFVEVTKDGKTTKELGFKIAECGPTIYEDVFGIYQQVNDDIGDPETGIDIIVSKDTTQQASNMYKAKAVIEGLSIKQTPFSDAEKELVPYDLKMFSKYADAEKLVENMNETFREIYDIDEEAIDGESSEK